MIVHGEGPVPARIMLVGEAPGEQEDRMGRPFVGKAGQELDRYLRLDAGLRRADVYITNLVKVRPPRNRDPNADEIARWGPELLEEIDHVAPRVIGAIGRLAARFLLDDPDFTMEVGHGLAYPTRWSGVCCVPLYHPAAALHQSRFGAATKWDFRQLGLVAAGVVVEERPIDSFDPVYLEVPHLAAVDTVALDTEGTRRKPWSVQISQGAGTGRMTRHGSLSWIAGPVIMHNAIHDLQVLKALKMALPTHFRDTMVEAYLLGVEPQGLKALAARRAGMKMQSYEELVAHGGAEKAKAYLEALADRLRPLQPQKAPKSKRAKKAPSERGNEEIQPA